MISISGFCSENDDFENTWIQLIEEATKNTIYSYAWKSSTYLKFGFDIFLSKQSLLTNALAFFLPSPFFWVKAIKTASFMGSYIYKLISHFNESIAQAKDSGKILAWVLALGFPFKY